MLLAIIVFLFYCWACDTVIVDGRLVNRRKWEEEQRRKREEAEK